jgi:hypothetical protein
MGVGTAGEANAFEFGLPHAQPAAVRQLKSFGADLNFFWIEAWAASPLICSISGARRLIIAVIRALGH